MTPQPVDPWPSARLFVQTALGWDHTHQLHRFPGKVELGWNLVCGDVPDQISDARFADDRSNCIIEVCNDDCRPVTSQGFACAEADLSLLISVWGQWD